MKLTKISTLLFLVFFCWLTFHAQLAHGQAAGGPGSQSVHLTDPLHGCGASGGESPFAACVSKLARALWILAVPICTLMILVGGFQILTAGGDPEKFRTGRQTILYAAIGLAVILLASAVPYIIDSVFR